MSVHVLLTTELWRKIAENHDDVYVYFREHGIRLSYVMYSKGKVDTLEFTNGLRDSIIVQLYTTMVCTKKQTLYTIRT